MDWSTMVDKEVEEAAFLFAPAALGEPDATMSLMTLEIWSTSSAMVERKVVQCSEQWMKIRRFWKHEWEMMGLGMHNDVHLYMRGVLRDWGAKKLGNFKSFEIHSVQEKELPVNVSTYINPI
jgi:hypothetical protein